MIDSHTTSLPCCIIVVLFTQPSLLRCKQNPILRLKNSVGTKMLCSECRKGLSLRVKLRKIVHYLCWVLAGTTEGELKMQENRKSRELKLGVYSI